MKPLKTKIKQSKWDEEFIKKYRLPSEFGGDSPLTDKERKFFTVVYWSILPAWVLMMVIYAVFS